MPRDGSGVYSLPAGTTASPNTTIESAKYNAFGADLVVDANAARPITAGGTGETTARLKDGTWRFQNTADTTKLLAFDLSGQTTATTRTATVPNHDLVVSGWKKGANIASAATLTLGTDGNYFNVTGTTTITALSVSGVTAGTRVLLEFDGAVTLTHGTNLVLPESTTFTTAAGDRGVFVRTPVGSVWLCESFTRATNPGQAIVALAGTSSTDVTIPDWANLVELAFYNVSPSGTATISVSLGDAGGFEATNYLGTVNTDGVVTALSTSFAIAASVAAGTIFGTMTLRRMSATVWVAASRMAFSNTPSFVEMAGGKSTDQTTTGLRVSVSAGTFDGGSMRAFFSR